MDMKKTITILSEYSGEFKHAGSKARADIYKILDEYKLPHIYNYSKDNDCSPEEKDIRYYIRRVWNSLKTIRALKKYKGLLIFAQFPDYSPSFVHSFIYNWIKKNRYILIIHDIDEWRYNSSDKKYIQLLNSALALIVHNKRMKNRLITEGVVSPKIIVLEIFDYLTDFPERAIIYDKSVVFAGNLGKSAFLNDWLDSKRIYDINLYGIGYQRNQKHNRVNYHGSFPADYLPVELNKGFGLVWDGESIETCSGNMGEYTRWNNPHKLSLYMAAGLPVIVWKNSAIADFVNKYNIGFRIDSLLEINQIMENITEADYNELVNNVRKIQIKICNGDYFRNAFEQILID